VVAGVGVVILFGAVIRLMGNIENAFNAVWHVSRPRGIARKFSDYLAFVVLAPLVLIVASSGAVFIAAELRQTVATVGPGWGEQMALRLAVSAFPLVLLWALFTFMYVFMPNTRVPWLSAVIGGIVGGSAYALLQFVYIRFQIGASNAGAVYGSFAALPLFLIWLQLSWLVVLLGAQLAYAHANVHAYARRRAGEGATHSLQRVLALALCGRCVAAFQQGQAPPTARDLAQALGVPQGLVNEALERLVAAGLLSEVVGEADEASGYQPAVPSEHLNTLMVLDRFDGGLPDGLSHALAPYAEALRNLQHGLAQSPQNLPLAQLAQHRRNR